MFFHPCRTGTPQTQPFTLSLNPPPPFQVVGAARRAYAEGRTRPIAFRRQQLQQYKQMLEDNREEFLEALAEDLNKVVLQTLLGLTLRLEFRIFCCQTALI